MTERMQAGEPVTISYSGYMEAKAISHRIDTFFREKAYDKHDINHEEQMLPEGLQIQYKKEPYKNVTHYAKFVMQVTLQATGLKPIRLKADDKKEVYEGELQVTIIPYLQMDWQGRWTSKPWFYGLARFMDYFVNKKYTENLEKGLREEAQLLASEIKTLLGVR